MARFALRLVVPVVLAAGESRRMGYPKALLPLGGTTFLGRILDTLHSLALPEPRVVVGGHAREIADHLTGRRARLLVNPEFRRGQLSSLQLALRDIPEDASACLVWPVDQPAVSEHLVRQLVRRYGETRAPLVLPRFGARRGHPAVIDRALFRECLEAPLEAGPKGVVARHEPEIVTVETGERWVVEDVDTPDDYERLTGVPLAQALGRTGA